MLRSRQMITAGIVAIAFVFAAAGCSSDSGQSLEDYLDEYRAISNEVDDRSAEVEESDAFATLSDPSIDFDERKDAIAEAFSELSDILDDAIADFEDLNPPADAEDLHERQLDAAQEVQDLFEQTRDDVDGADSDDDLLAIFEGDFEADLDAAGADGDDACEELQDLADDEDVDVDLECGE